MEKRIEQLREEYQTLNRTIENLKLDGAKTNDSKIIQLEDEMDAILKEVRKIRN